ncbi:hypothetical protein Pelo_15673 [Pelomyxa schiedti]|nr:hypothetical protein Pelo_15673 [Pelomyxa schiedti]
MAPEVLSGQPYTDQCGTWSLGCILHAVTTSTPPKGILNPTPDFFETIADRSVCLILQSDQVRKHFKEKQLLKRGQFSLWKSCILMKKALQPKVRKCFLELHGIELLCTSLNDQQGQTNDTSLLHNHRTIDDYAWLSLVSKLSLQKYNISAFPAIGNFILTQTHSKPAMQRLKHPTLIT